jgi:hypothetical protein
MKNIEQYEIKYNFKNGEYWKIAEKDIIDIEYTQKNMKNNHNKAEKKFINKLIENNIKEFKIISISYI